jgi:hypothetical protein
VSTFASHMYVYRTRKRPGLYSHVPDGMFGEGRSQFHDSKRPLRFQKTKRTKLACQLNGCESTQTCIHFLNRHTSRTRL